VKRTTVVTAVLCLGLAVSGCSCKNKDDVDANEPPDTTPVVHSTISPKVPKGCGAFFSYHYGDAYKTLREVEDYRRGSRDYYVRELSDRRNEYLLAGISPNERREWLSSHKVAEKDQHCLVPLFDEIGAAAKNTLPKYHPRGYTHHDGDEMDLIKNAVREELPDAKFIAVGVKSPSWMIEKHSNGVPSQRYKYGMAWVKSPTFDDGYCRIYYVNILQDYAGGSSYGDSTANYISKEPVGCD
jgi:hypothetical protein